MTEISGQGRLGAAPVLKSVRQGDDQQFVCELRVKFLNSKLKKNTEIDIKEKEYDDLGFWVQVSVWGAFAESTAKLLKKGDRVYLPGNLYQSTWPDKNDPEKENSMLKINTNLIFPYLPDIESLQYKARKSSSAQTKTYENDPGFPKTGTNG